ncbi:N-acetylmuramoyl-L-alanine amidase [Chitinimonas sp.]|uniref:N-acetylmuramoyl-L-alanine amidase n=1 Tax=Chitinimonas sp. TaxID=1934313 RepID=UPI0035B369E1
MKRPRGFSALVCALALLALTVNAGEARSQPVRFLIMHYTTLNYAASLKKLSQPDENGSRVSAHYLIPEDGDASFSEPQLLAQPIIAEDRVAWHAGISRWEQWRGLNEMSIGIENVNTTHCQEPETSVGPGVPEAPPCFYQDYSPAQLDMLLALSKRILARYPEISPTHVLGHADIAATRKADPGPRFPWQWLYRHGVGAWYEEATQLRYWKQWRDKPLDIALLQRALQAYGYAIAVTGQYDLQTRDHLLAFQAHFRPHEMTGKPSAATLATALALLDKYFPERLEAMMRSDKNPAELAR